MTSSPSARRYPMPCPACRRMIDAWNVLCPYCGVDTDAVLGPMLVKYGPLVRMAPLVLLALFALAGHVLPPRPRYFVLGLLAGALVVRLVAVWLRRSRG